MDSTARTEFEYTPENEKQFQSLLGKYPTRQAVLLPALWLAQNQAGYLSVEAMDYVAGRLDQSPVSVYAVVEFYTLFHTTPPGKHHIQLCQTVSCWMRGSDDLKKIVESKLGLKPGECTDDGRISYETVECLGSCGTAPMMRLDNRYFENLTPDKFERIIDACRDGRDPVAEDHE